MNFGNSGAPPRGSPPGMGGPGIALPKMSPPPGGAGGGMAAGMNDPMGGVPAHLQPHMNVLHGIKGLIHEAMQTRLKGRMKKPDSPGQPAGEPPFDASALESHYK